MYVKDFPLVKRKKEKNRLLSDKLNKLEKGIKNLQIINEALAKEYTNGQN